MTNTAIQLKQAQMLVTGHQVIANPGHYLTFTLNGETYAIGILASESAPR